MLIDPERVADFWPDANQTLLLHAVIDDLPKAKAPLDRWLTVVDFENIDAGSQRLLPLLYSRLQTLQIEHPLVARIKGIFRRNWYFEQRIRSQLRSVHTSFQHGGLDCILLKGTALRLDVYDHGSFRPADDIDLLVRRETVNHAADLLQQDGWRVGDIGGVVGRHARIMHSDICSVDLHISPFHERLQDEAINPLWDFKREIMFDGSPAFLLSPHDQLLHTIVHGLRVNVVPPIRWVADAVIMIRRYSDRLDWDRFVRTSEKLAYTLVASRALTYLATEFHAPVPKRVLNRLKYRLRGVLERIEFRCEREELPPSRFDAWMLRRRDRRNLGIDEVSPADSNSFMTSVPTGADLKRAGLSAFRNDLPVSCGSMARSPSHHERN